MKILIIDDHPLLRAGLVRLFAIEFDATVAEAADAAEGLRLFRAFSPDMTVLDLNLPDQGGLSLLRKLKCDDPAAPIVILSMHNDALSAAAALRAGAIGYLSKSAAPDLILEAVRFAQRGDIYIEPSIAQALAIQRVTGSGDPLLGLTPNDIELLRLIAAGKRNDQIAASLGVAEKTVANRKTNLRTRLRVGSDVELMKAAMAAGISFA